MDSNALRDAITQRSGEIDQQSVNINKIYDEIININNEAAGLITTDKNGNTPDMVRAKGIAELEAQRRTQAVAEALGLSTDFATDAQIAAARRFRANSDAAVQQGQRISQLESVGLTDNPIEYLINQWMLPDEYAKYDGFAAGAKQADKELTDINQQTQQAAVTANTLKKTLTEATLEQQVTAAENSLKLQKLQLAKENLATDAQMIREMFELKGKQFDLAKQRWEIAKTEEQMSFQREQALMLREQRKQAMQEKLDKEADKKQAQAAILEAINAGRIKRHGADIAPVGMEIFQKGLFGSKTGVGKQLDEYYNVGLDVVSGINPVFGNAVETAAMLQKGDQVSGTNIKGSQEVADLVKAAVKRAEETAPSKKPEDVNQVAQDLIKKQLEMRMRTIDAADQTNPFGLQATGVIDQAKNMQGDKGWQIYRTLVTGDQPLDYLDYRVKMAKAVADGSLTLEEATKSITDIAAASAVYNEKSTNLYYLTGRHQTAMGVKVPDVDVTGNRTRMGIIGTAALATGAPMVATGVGTIPGAALVAGGSAAVLYARPSDKNVDLFNREQVRKDILTLIGRTN